MSELIQKSLTQIRELLGTGEVSAQDVTRACLDRVKATDDTLGALLSVDAEQAMSTASALDEAGHDPARPLWGVPLVMKDVLATRDAPTTCGSKILENFRPVYDATAVSKLREAGAVIIGKANMDEFAMGTSNENSAYGPSRNPWNTDHVPGGSSGGSGASVCAGQCFGATGTDTGGSIRTPASFCGIVGIKPSYGRVSRFGLIAYGSSLDQIGPMTRTVEDSARLLQVMAGHDCKDSTSVDRPVDDYIAAATQGGDLSGLTIGLPEEYFGEGLSEEVDEACRAAVDTAVKLGAKTKKVNLTLLDYAVSMYYIIATAEASSNLSRFDGVRYGYRNKDAAELIDMYTRSRTEGFGDEVQRRIILGTYVLSSGYYDAYYRKAAQVRRLLRDEFRSVFSECDVIAGPVCPTTAFKIGDKVDDPMQMYLMDIYTLSANLAGIPGMSIPVGLGKDTGLPVGLQLMGPAFGETTLIRTAAALERELGGLGIPSL